MITIADFKAGAVVEGLAATGRVTVLNVASWTDIRSAVARL